MTTAKDIAKMLNLENAKAFEERYLLDPYFHAVVHLAMGLQDRVKELEPWEP